MHTINTLRPKSSRKGNVLVGCLIALGIAIILVIVATVFVMKSWRGWASTGIKQGITAVLDETQIEQTEKDEINAHILTLMNRFEIKEISLEELGMVSVEILEGPLLPAGIVAASYEGYFASAELDDEIKADAKLQLARVANGMYTEAIDIDKLNEILEPIEADAISGNSGVQVQAGDVRINLKDSDEVTIEELTELIANARAAADEAGVDQVPEMIDLSNEVAIAIANALGEAPSLWLPEGVVYVPEPEVEEEAADTDNTDGQDEPTDDSTDTDSDDEP